jgi:flavin reductase (DIM6/NTAB) family NADH-FMN oxidoreductase RutF
MIVSFPEIDAAGKQYWLQHLVGPRPIALASTVNKAGQVNLSPFSFFNVFSIDPPILIFSPSRRVRDSTVKHTLENVLEVPEVVINTVHFEMLRQVVVSSGEYPRGVDEFEMAALTKSPAKMVQPPLVAESRASFECRVLEVKPMGMDGGAGNLVICEVLCMHLKEEMLTDMGKVDARKLDLVARMGGNWYARAKFESLFELAKL